MGYLDASTIRQAGEYLLSVLHEYKSVRYSDFYDGLEETHEALRDAIGLENDWYSAETLMDEAAGQLAATGIVEIAVLPERLCDEEFDYAITLTEEGQSFLRKKQPFPFRDVDL